MIESHLFGFDGVLYGSRVTVHFVDYIRPMNKFPDADSLAAQMAADAEEHPGHPQSMMSTRSTGLNARSLAWLGIAGVLILALGARTGVAAIAPIAHEIELDVELGGIWLGLLGMIPPISYALAGLFTPRLVRQLSLEGLAIAVSVLTAAAHIARGFTPNYLGLFLSTVVLMLGVGAINVILPGLVKLYAPRHIGPVTSLYSTAMAISTASPARRGSVVSRGLRLALVARQLVAR